MDSLSPSDFNLYKNFGMADFLFQLSNSNSFTKKDLKKISISQFLEANDNFEKAITENKEKTKVLLAQASGACEFVNSLDNNLSKTYLKSDLTEIYENKYPKYHLIDEFLNSIHN